MLLLGPLAGNQPGRVLDEIAWLNTNWQVENL
jgi:hypothetical protein